MREGLKVCVCVFKGRQRNQRLNVSVCEVRGGMKEERGLQVQGKGVKDGMVFCYTSKTRHLILSQVCVYLPQR